MSYTHTHVRCGYSGDRAFDVYLLTERQFKRINREKNTHTETGKALKRLQCGSFAKSSKLRTVLVTTERQALSTANVLCEARRWKKTSLLCNGVELTIYDGNETTTDDDRRSV